MIDPLAAREVAVFRDQKAAGYPDDPPFGPDERYPEYPLAWPAGRSADGGVYRQLRNVLAQLGLDRENFSRPSWNPLGRFIRPGDTVLVKPNWVFHHCPGVAPVEALMVNASVIRPVLDYAAIALQGQGRIVLADAPMQSADFGLILGQAGVPSLLEFWSSSGLPSLEVRDLRREAVSVSGGDRIISRHTLPGDPEGYRAVDLGSRSRLFPLDKDSPAFRVTNYRTQEMTRHHNSTVHEYLISGSLLAADAVINLAKLKTHRKGGMTCALKNMVGISGGKDWLPHHRAGSTEEGGDEYAGRNFFKRLSSLLGDRLADRDPGAGYDILRQLRRLAAVLGRITSDDPFFEGSWYGNDTLWRMVLDLVVIALYADREGVLSPSPARRHLAIVDAVVAGEGDGPLEAAPRKAGILIAGANPLAVDTVAATLIGLDWRKIPLVAEGYRSGGGDGQPALAGFSCPQVRILSNVPAWDGARLDAPSKLEGRLDFTPAPGWKSHVELS